MKLQLENNTGKKKKQINQYVDIKQHDINHPVIQRRNQKRNLKNTL